MAGNIKIIEPTERYIKVSRGIVRDDAVDVLTLGVYVKILVLGKDWKLNIAGLGLIFRKTGFRISDNKVRESIVKLESLGYIRRVADRDENNRMLGWDYYVYFEPVAEEQRTRAGFPSYTKSDNTKVPSYGISDNTENGEEINKEYKENKTLSINKDNKGNKRSTTPAFDFLSALLNLGVSESTAKDWLQVRKQKGGVNTQTAFNDICREIDRTGASAEDCIRMAVVNTWRGFKADWYLTALAKETPSPVPQTPSPSGRTSTVEHNLRTLAQLHINAGATTITEDEEYLPF